MKIFTFSDFIVERLSDEFYKTLDDIENIPLDKKKERLQRSNKIIKILKDKEQETSDIEKNRLLLIKIEELEAEINHLKNLISIQEPVEENLEYLNEGEGYATGGNTGGMGDVVAPTVGTTPGAVWGEGSGSKGSGDLPYYIGVGSKTANSLVGFNPNKRKKKKGKRVKKFSEM